MNTYSRRFYGVFVSLAPSYKALDLLTYCGMRSETENGIPLQTVVFIMTSSVTYSLW